MDSTNCQVNGMTRNGDNGIFSVGIDDCLKKVEDLAVNSDTKVKLSSQPKAVDSDKGLTFVATVNSVAIIQDNSIIHEQKMEYEPACIAVSPRHQHIIVGEGGHSGKCIHVYRCNETGDMTELFTAPLSGAVTDVVFSPDQELCAVADSNRKVTLLKVGEEKYEKAHSKVGLTVFFCYFFYTSFCTYCFEYLESSLICVHDIRPHSCATILNMSLLTDHATIYKLGLGRLTWIAGCIFSFFYQLQCSSYFFVTN